MTNTLTACVAVIALAAVECVALLTGHDGKILCTVIAIIAGVAGWHSKAAWPRIRRFISACLDAIPKD